MGKSLQKQRQGAGRRNFLRSIRGKVILMGGVAIAASVILGYVGMTALNRNSQNNRVLTDINRINLYQYENQSLDTSYLYFLDSSYLEKITDNLGKMESLADTAADSAGSGVRDDIRAMADIVKECKGNYEEILTLSNERGFVSEAGEYAVFLSQDEEIDSVFTQIKDDKSWVDGTWRKLTAGGKTVRIGGRQYFKYTYKSEVPDVGKRETFLARIGGTAVEYSGRIYLNNITFVKGGTKKRVDIASFTKEALSGTYGDAFKGMDIKKFDGKDSIVVESKFTKANQAWEEVSVKMPMSDFNMQDYDSMSYDVYFEAGKGRALSAASAFADKYDFNGGLETINAQFAAYSGHVVEGNDVEEEALSIQSLFEEIIANLQVYVNDEAGRDSILEKVNGKLSEFTEIAKKDSRVLERKKENIRLSGRLTQYTDEVREAIDENTEAVKRQLFVTILFVLLAGAAVILVITFFIGGSMNRSVAGFRDMLSSMTGGNLSVRADETGKDEFSVFGKYINDFLGKISEVICLVQNISDNVRKSGDALGGMAKGSGVTSGEINKAIEDISSGAATQAEEVESASRQITEMGSAFGNIVDNIAHLEDVTDEIKQISDESVVFMKELSDANQKTSDAFSKVVQQIHVTNDSVKKIREATELITSIADQTNLLSLNASIEAARAGEAGRGFAVVAGEISQLAAQSASSADIIRGIIEEVVQEAELTVGIVDAVSEIIVGQQDKLNQTSSHFVSLEKGIVRSNDEMVQIKRSTAVCEDARKNVDEIITGLSAISEENAASAEETTASMSELNETISQLVTTARELDSLAAELDGNLKFFQI